jgi:cytochrome c peroxidase
MVLAAVALTFAVRAQAAEQPVESGPDLVEQGRRLFESTTAFGQKSSEGPTMYGLKVSCRSCHGGPATTDHRNHVVGPTENRERVARHTPHLFNLAETAPYGWDGRNATLAAQMRGAITSPLEMNGREPTDEELAALEAFVLTLEAPAATPGTDFDAAKAARGEAVFNDLRGTDPSGAFPAEVKVGCATCHTGEAKTDNGFHKILFPFGEPVADPGRERDGAIQGFNTPSLEGLRLTAPYFHEGLAGDPTGMRTPPNDPRNALKLTVEFYSARFLMSLTEDEQNDLVEYLLSL